MDSMATTTDNLRQAFDLYQRGCLSAAESCISDCRDFDKEHSPEASALSADIQRLKDVALNPPKETLQFCEGALISETTKLFVRDTCELTRRGERSLDRDLIISAMVGGGDESQKMLGTRGYTPLYIESANCLDSIKRNMAGSLFETNDREAAGRAVRDGLRECPFVSLWHGEIESIAATSPPLVRIARLLVNPLDEEEDRRRAHNILCILNQRGEDELVEADDFDFFRHDELRVEDEADIPTIRWWAAFLLIDAKLWDSAQAVVRAVLSDCTVNGIWPAYYLPEALYLAAFVEFGLGKTNTCLEYLKAYFDVAARFDRNRADALLLQLWAAGEAPPRPSTLQHLCRRCLKEAKMHDPDDDEHVSNPIERLLYYDLPELREALSLLWDDHMFADFTWIRVQVAERLGVKDENPFIKLKKHIENQWRDRPGIWRPPHMDPLLQRLEKSCGRTITIRHWEPKNRRAPWG